MAKDWFILALAATVLSSFLLWESLSEAERARYFGLIATAPITVYAILGLVGRGYES